MTTIADWQRDILDAAEERGWAPIAIDARLSMVVLEEPFGSGGLVVRIQGKTLTGAFIRAMPTPGTWEPPEAEVAGG